MSLVWLIAFSFFSVVHARPEAVVEDLESIQVTARKRVSDFNFSKAHTLDSTQLEGGPFNLLSPKLTEVPGVITTQTGGPGGTVSYFIRGTESRHVSFTIDGLKMNDPSGVGRQFDTAFFSSAFLGQVEIHKGPQAVLYGSDSIGGQVDLTTRKGEDAPETRLELNGGSFGTIDSSLSSDWKKNGSQGTLTAYRLHSDGISRLNKKRFNAKEEDSTDITQLVSSSKHKWASNLQTDLLISFLRGENELDGFNEDNSNDHSTNDQYLLQQRTNLNLNKTSAISLRNGLNRHVRNIEAKDFSNISREESLAGDLIQNEALFKFQQKSLSFLAGMSSEHEEINLSGVDRSFDLHSLFLQSALTFSRIKFHVGGRAENHIRYGSFTTGSSGASFTLGKHIFSAQYSQGFKSPSLYQLYAPPTFGKLGNPDLVPEINHSWEGGWHLQDKFFDGGVSLFQNRLSNLVTYTMANGYVNQARFIAEGVELSGKYKQRGYQLISSYTHQEFRKEDTVVLRRPLNSFMGGIVLFPTDSSEVSFKGKWFSSRKDVDELGNTVKLNSYETFDLGVRQVFSTFDIGVQVLNLLNRDYEELYGYSIMPRSVFLHTGVRF